MNINLRSSAFENDGLIPSKYTCDGENISPNLNWDNLPSGTKTLAIILNDLDAPSGDFVHWIIYNIPSNVKNLQENLRTTFNTPDEVRIGTNSFGRIGYGGPCPPSGTHHYHFNIYALNTILHLDVGATKKELMTAMNGHIISEGLLIGKYTREKR